MKLIKPSVEILDRFLLCNNPAKHQIEDWIFRNIEVAGRTCYKSEDKMTNDSLKKFVEMLINREHTAMLEHGIVYLLSNNEDINEKYAHNKYSRIVSSSNMGSLDCDCYTTTNYRVLYENGWLDDLQYLCLPTEHHEKRISVRFICDRGVSHELVRHRAFSFAQESTRYCNYSKDKHDNQCTFIIPNWITDIEEGEYLAHAEYHHAKDDVCKQWYDVCMNADFVYIDLIQGGWQPQQARAVLPNSLKTEVVMTGFVSDWKQFFELRTKKDCHPQMLELTIPLYEQFKEKGYV